MFEEPYYTRTLVHYILALRCVTRSLFFIYISFFLNSSGDSDVGGPWTARETDSGGDRLRASTEFSFPTALGSFAGGTLNCTHEEDGGQPH